MNYQEILKAVDLQVKGNLADGGGAWSKLAERSLPDWALAIEEFRADLMSASDLTSSHVNNIVHQILPYQCVEDSLPMVSSCVSRFLHLLRPWYDLWYAFVGYVIEWCLARQVISTIFIGRDTLPFYYLAQGIATVHDTPHLAFLEMSRSFRMNPMPITIGADSSPLPKGTAAYVDSGCYGTLIRDLIGSDRMSDGAQTLPAVFFYYSRNPHIFGYMNYLVFAHYCLPLYRCSLSYESWCAGLQHERGGQTMPTHSFLADYSCPAPQEERPMDLAAMAFDTVEAIPKAYAIRDVSRGHSVTSWLSFALAVSLYTDLYRFAQHKAQQPDFFSADKGFFSTLRYISDISQHCAEGATNHDVPFWIPPTPKWEAGEEWLRSWKLGTLPPQTEIFGVLAG